MKYKIRMSGQTAYNRTVYALPQICASAYIRLGRRRLKSAGSHASFRQIGGGGLCFAKPFYAAVNFINSRSVMRSTTIFIYFIFKTVLIIAV